MSYVRETFFYRPHVRRTKAVVMGKVAKGIKCTVTGCTQDAVRSISPDDVAKAGLQASTPGRGYLCKTHYKELKKKLRKDRELERWRMRP